MRIAQIAPLHESVPPSRYGGTERVVSYLTEELVRLGHDVTLFATADSVTSARLYPICPRALRTDAECIDPLAHHVYMAELAARHSDRFDIIHSHIDYLAFMLFRRLPIATVTTLHGRLDIPDSYAVYNEFGELPLVSISDSQRDPVPALNWINTVHHGLPRDSFSFSPSPENYVAFVGRISPEKRLDRAIKIACAAGVPLVIGAKVDRSDQQYFEDKIEPLLGHPLVRYLGELSETEKTKLLSGAKALLFPIDWPEPFGLVMIEAMACGTPIIAWAEGSVPEVVKHGISGFIVNSVEEGVQALTSIDKIDRKSCRMEFERGFTSVRMAKDYVDVYEQIIQSFAAEMSHPAAELYAFAKTSGQRP
ncbi:MAG: glycosyltransferase family 4 protein [Deltaproteobacteria bacterium]|nr:glycosyltransferase family 4 protein [Deltaproteobacteria bacterium]